MARVGLKNPVDDLEPPRERRVGLRDPREEHLAQATRSGTVARAAGRCLGRQARQQPRCLRIEESASHASISSAQSRSALVFLRRHRAWLAAEPGQQRAVRRIERAVDCAHEGPGARPPAKRQKLSDNDHHTRVSAPSRRAATAASASFFAAGTAVAASGKTASAVSASVSAATKIFRWPGR